MGVLRKFRFPLARVLSVREIERRLAAGRVAEANARLLAAEAKLRAARESIASLEGDLAWLRGQRQLEPSACLAVEALLDWARGGERQCAVAVAEREDERDRALAAHTEAHRKVRALGRLEEIRRDEHAQERRLAESKTMDEVASVRSRGRGAGDWAEDPLAPHEPSP